MQKTYRPAPLPGEGKAGDAELSPSHRPAHHQLALRGAGRALEVRSRERTFTPRARPAARRLRRGHARARKRSTTPASLRLPLVNKIRPRVKAWREAGYPGRHRHDEAAAGALVRPGAREQRRFFFCQLEAIETLIWLAEAPAADQQGIDVPGDGGPFARLCTKMATGSGKTIVMAMLIAWQILNKVAQPQDKRFSKNVLVVARG